MMEVYGMTVDFADGSKAEYEGMSLMDLTTIVDTFENLSVMDARITLDVHQRRQRALKYLVRDDYPFELRDREGVRKWLLYGDLSEVPEPVAAVLGEWETTEIRAGRTIC